MNGLKRGGVVDGSAPEKPKQQPGRWALFVESHQVVNSRRIEQAFVFATTPKIKSALSSLENSLPWVDAGSINSPGRVYQRLSEEGKPFVLVVDDAGISILDKEKFRLANPGAIVILISSLEFIGCAPPHSALERHPFVSKADIVFYAPESSSVEECSAIISSAIRCAEDKINIEEGFHKKRSIFLVVDDEPRWYSQFLPVLYRIIGRRADVMVARTHEEAAGIFIQHGDDIVCLIADVNFTRDGAMGPNGIALAKITREGFPRIPIIIASKAEIPEDLRDMALLMPKGDEGANKELERYVREFTGLGDFLFFDGKRELLRATNLTELRDRIFMLPARVLEQYAERDYFSTWLYMHAFPELADVIRPVRSTGEELRRILLFAIDRKLEDIFLEPLVFLDENGQAVAKASNLEGLVKVVGGLDISVLQFYSDMDGFSTWLMRKGYMKLAEELRPVHGKGEELRERMLEIISKYKEE
jgi:hypothetical protein